MGSSGSAEVSTVSGGILESGRGTKKKIHGLAFFYKISALQHLYYILVKNYNNNYKL